MGYHIKLKWVPWKIKDFLGCIKGVRLTNNLGNRGGRRSYELIPTQRVFDLIVNPAQIPAATGHIPVDVINQTFIGLNLKVIA
jgi:hypothetical protein